MTISIQSQTLMRHHIGDRLKTKSLIRPFVSGVSSIQIEIDKVNKKIQSLEEKLVKVRRLLGKRLFNQAVNNSDVPTIKQIIERIEDFQRQGRIWSNRNVNVFLIPLKGIDEVGRRLADAKGFYDGAQRDLDWCQSAYEYLIKETISLIEESPKENEQFRSSDAIISRWPSFAKQSVVSQPMQSISHLPDASKGLYPSCNEITIEPISIIDNKMALEKRLREAYGRTAMQSTGYRIKRGETLKVNLHYPGKDLMPEVWIHSLDDESPHYEKKQKEPLRRGRQIITAKKDGIIYLVPNSSVLGGTVTLEGGVKMPRFLLSEAYSHENWKQILKQYNDAPYVEFVSKRVMITTTLASAKKHVDDPKKVLSRLDQMVEEAEGLFGFLPGRAEPDAPTTGRYHFVEVPYDLNMRSPDTSLSDHVKGPNIVANIIGYRSNYRPTTIHYVLNSQYLGFVVGHELAHSLESRDLVTDAEKDTDAVTNLIPEYLLRVLKLRDKDPWIKRLPDSWLKIQEYLNQPTRDWNQQEDKEIRLALFLQLYFAFGKNFYQKFGVLSRKLEDIPYEYDSNKKQTDLNIKKKQTRLISMCSRIAGYNLIPFFERWGFSVSEEAKDAVQYLPVLNEPIWKNTDTKVEYQYPLNDDEVPLLKEEQEALDKRNSLKREKAKLFALIKKDYLEKIRERRQEIRKAKRELLLMANKGAFLMDDRRSFSTVAALKKAIDEKVNSSDKAPSPYRYRLENLSRRIKELLNVQKEFKTLLKNYDSKITHAKQIEDVKNIEQNHEEWLSWMKGVLALFNVSLLRKKVDTQSKILHRVKIKQEEIQKIEASMLDNLIVDECKYSTLEKLKEATDEKFKAFVLLVLYDRKYYNQWSRLEKQSQYIDDFLKMKNELENQSSYECRKIEEATQMLDIEEAERNTEKWFNWSTEVTNRCKAFMRG